MDSSAACRGWSKTAKSLPLDSQTRSEHRLLFCITAGSIPLNSQPIPASWFGFGFVHHQRAGRCRSLSHLPWRPSSSSLRSYCQAEWLGSPTLCRPAPRPIQVTRGHPGSPEVTRGQPGSDGASRQRGRYNRICARSFVDGGIAGAEPSRTRQAVNTSPGPAW